MRQEKRKNRDPRIKKRNFSWLRFLVLFVVMITLALSQSVIITNYYQADEIPSELIGSIIHYWLIVAVLFTLAISFFIRVTYEKPMEKISDATRKIAKGDFSVALTPRHKPEELDHLDVMFLDFNKMVDELKGVEIFQSDFMSNVSHEFKTPLSVIRNYVTLLEKGNISEQQKQEYMDIIIQATDQLGELVSNILKMSKLDSQAIVSSAEPFDLCRQLGDTVLLFESRLEEKGLIFNVEMEDHAYIAADASMMAIVWNNLLSNAIKFTDPGGQIELEQVTDGEYVEVTVSDSGCGMDKETQEHVFDKFYQGNTSHAKEGNGLGLALVKRVLELNDGAIFVTSVPGTGSSFHVQLKCAYRQGIERKMYAESEENFCTQLNQQ